MRPESYSTPGGITVTRTISRMPYTRGLRGLLRKLDTQRGVYLSSGYEYPERYSRWDIASVCPPLEIVSRGRELEVHALNDRGRVLLDVLDPVLARHPHWASTFPTPDSLRGELKPLPALFPEEQRSKQPSAFSILRSLIEEFRNDQDGR